MILHITGAGFDKALAIEFLEQILGALTQGVDQHIQATPVGHADNQLLGPVATHTLNDFVHQRNQGFAPFQTETLGTRVLAAQIFFQAFCGGETLENMLLDVFTVLWMAAHTFHALLEPAFFRSVDDMHVFSTHAGTVGALQTVNDFTEGGFGLADKQVTGLEYGIQVRGT